jgi:hypothetical protein
MEVRRRSVGNVCQDSDFSAVRTLPANPEGSVPRRRTELVHVVEQVAVDGIGACMCGSEGATFECRVQILVMGRPENIECLRVENRQKVSVGLCDDVFDAVDLVPCMRGRHSESRHVWCQRHGHVICFSAIGGYADRAFEESGELLEVGFARVACVEREIQIYPCLRDRLLALGASLPAHVPYLAVRFDVEFVV